MFGLCPSFGDDSGDFIDDGDRGYKVRENTRNE